MASESAALDSSGICVLVVVGEIFEEYQKELVLNSVVEGLKSIDTSLNGQDVHSLLQKASENFQISDENEGKCLSHTSEGGTIEILLKPHLKQLLCKLKTFLTQPSPYHHLIFAGSSIRGSCNWLLSDATFSFANFSDVFKTSEVVTVLKDGSLKGIMAINCKPGAEWTETHLSKLSSSLCFKLNPPISEEIPDRIIQMRNSLTQHISYTHLQDLLEESSVVGSIRFHRPTIYIFPAGLGSSCLFGVSGFSLLVDGGFARRSCFWDFARHLERLDVLLLTHLAEDNVFGVASALERKRDGMVHPELGCVFANCIGNTSKLKGGGGLEVDVGVEGGRMVEMMQEMGIQPRPCIGTTLKGVLQPINLYHKVGHGSLDLYVLIPLQDSRPLKDFLASWSRNSHPFVTKANSLPLSSLASVCAVVVWQPALQPPTRLLFPGTAPQHTILEALERLSSIPLFQTFEGKPPVKRLLLKNSNKVASTVSPKSSSLLVKSEGSTKGLDKKWPIKKGLEKGEEKDKVDVKSEAIGLLGGLGGVGGEVEKSENESRAEKENKENSEEKPSEKPDDKINFANEQMGENENGDLIQFESPMNLPPPTSLSTKHNLLKSAPRSSLISTRKSSQEIRKQKHSQKPAFHCDLAYIPSHGDPRYVDGDFFSRVRARYYILSNPNPSSSLLNSLLDAKEAWGEDGDVVVIPTHDTEVLRFWIAAHHDQLSHARLSVAPAANRCSVQLQDHHTNCAAYRLEF